LSDEINIETLSLSFDLDETKFALVTAYPIASFLKALFEAFKGYEFNLNE